MALKKFKVSGVSDIFVNEGGGGATTYATKAAFPDPTANDGQFAVDASNPGGGQGSLYCAFAGNWCFITILAP